MKFNPKASEKSALLDVYADLDMFCDAGKIVLKADGRTMVVRFPSLGAVFDFLKLIEIRYGFTKFLKEADRVLTHADITLFWQNRYFGILGSHGNPFLLAAIIGIQKIIRLSPGAKFEKIS